MLHVSRFGNWIFAVGGDLQSARATGIPTDRVKIGLFMASAFGAALVGVIQTIIYNSAQVANGQSFVFNSIIAVVIGGVLLTGGYGSVVGVMLGTLTFAIVGQGIYYTGWNSGPGQPLPRRPPADRRADEQHLPPDGAVVRTRKKKASTS